MKLMIVLLTLLISFSTFALETGTNAPDFEVAAAGSKIGKVKLSDFKSKVVVLEWLNHGCPFVRKHYDSGNMQALQKKYTSKNVIWWSIISSAPGKQGFVEAPAAREEMIKNNSSATNILLDSDGKVGKLFEAKTTPHMFIINKGKLVYQGAIDDKIDTLKESVSGAKNYLSLALDQILEGKPVTIHTTQSYGCSVKY
jgi:hypothetical protein